MGRGRHGKWVKAEEAHNRDIVKGLAGLGIHIGSGSKKSHRAWAAQAAFKEKTVELLAGTREVNQRAVQSVRK